jgi:16S rRNA (adenine1518-N6/adenine1519-N6)-dimethyltransferase
LELQIPLFLVEIDTDLAQFWRDKGLTMIEQDALKLDWDSFSSTLVRPSILVSNLPYQISSRLVVDRSLDARPLDAMILMFQKEVALKILAQAPSAETGFLSVLAQSFWQVRSLVKAKAGDFLPPPKVASQVLVFKPISPPLIKDKKMYLEFLKASFSAPRKLLSSNLKQLFSAQVVTQAFDQLQFKENTRAHELFIPDWVRLFEFLKSRLDHRQAQG